MCGLKGGMSVKKTRYTGRAVYFALRLADTETPVGEVIRKMGISRQRFYRYRVDWASDLE